MFHENIKQGAIEMKEQEVQENLTKALDKLILKDDFLLKIDAHERTIAHKLAEYLQQEFPYWHVDCEYNRYKDKEKKVNQKKESIFPDIIIHRRNSNENILAIEIKKISYKKKRKLTYEELLKKYKNDIEKLNYYKENLSYQYTLFIEFYVDKIDNKNGTKAYRERKSNKEEPYETYWYPFDEVPFNINSVIHRM
jgi:hypothetical protein